MKHLITLSILLFIIVQRPFAQDCSDLTGTWQNELGSQLVIESITPDSQIEGVYKSSSGVDGKTFALMGWVNNYQKQGESAVSIAFSVRWEGYASITSWTGSCAVDDEGPFIKTLWHLVRPDTEFEWERVIANSSTFRPVGE